MSQTPRPADLASMVFSFFFFFFVVGRLFSLKLRSLKTESLKKSEEEGRN